MPIISRISSAKLNDVGFRMRVLAATYQRRNIPVIQTNSDAIKHTKCFAHDSNGQLTTTGATNYTQLEKALDSGKDGDFSTITLAGGKLVDPQCSLYTPLEGADTSVLPTVAPPRLNSAKHVAEMLEDYAMELARDVPFIDYSSDPTITSLLSNTRLNSPDFLAQYDGPVSGGLITSSNIFAGANFAGPYISQLFYYPLTNPGMDVVEQKYLAPKSRAAGVVDFGAVLADMVSVQNGTTLPNSNTRFESTKRYIYNGRVLAEAVHVDSVYQFYYNIALQLSKIGAQRNAGWVQNACEVPFAAFGGNPDMMGSLADASLIAIRHTWYHKWQIHKRLRPEETSILLDRQKNSIADFNYLDTSLLANPILDDVAAMHNTYYGTGSYILTSCYPEGSPAHPSYPAGHATVAGAAITILKAYLNCSARWMDMNTAAWPNKTMQANSDGTALVAVADNAAMTLNSELNKLAYNVALGRDWANVHYRADGEMGILLGEEVAINYMKDKLAEYNQTHTRDNVSITIQKVDGSSYKITPTVV